MASIEQFEDHCWKDVVPAADMKLYSCYARATYVGPRPALLAIDLYNIVYRGGPHSPYELDPVYPNNAEFTLTGRSSRRNGFLQPRAAPQFPFSIARRKRGRTTGLPALSRRGARVCRCLARTMITIFIGNSRRRSPTSSSASSAPAFSKAPRSFRT